MIGRNEMKEQNDDKACSPAVQKEAEGKKELELEKKQLFWSRVTGISSLLAFLCILAVAVSVLSFMPHVGELINNLDEISTELKDTSTEVTKVLRSLNEKGLEEIYGTLDSVQKIDIEKLNESIDSLHRIIEPLASLFS